jgi:hypothetical protein
MSAPGKAVASVASVLRAGEVADLVAIALSLPEDWCVQVLPPHGQLSVTPLTTRRTHHRCWTAARRWGAIRRESGIT